MKFNYLIITCICIGLSGCTNSTDHNIPKTSTSLWYNKPATKWVEALPVGNSSLGAMIYGNPASEHIQFNEETLWTGGPHDYAHKGAHQYLDSLRNLLKKDKYSEAHNLGMEHFMSVPLHQKAYQPFGDLYLDFNHSNPDNYSRSLDIENALQLTRYHVGDTSYARSVFASHPDQVMVMNISSNKRNAISFSISLTAEHDKSEVFKIDDKTLGLKVAVTDGALHGEARVKVVNQGGEVEFNDGTMQISSAQNVMLILSAATNYISYNDISGKPAEINKNRLSAIEGKSYNDLLTTHINDYQSLYNRFDIELGAGKRDSIPTDVRIKNYVDDPDPSLSALYVQYGRYLMIASSRAGTQPANLQGIWNDRIKPPWESKWTVNINAEMNFWLAEPGNLPECHQSLFGLIEDVSETGKSVAREHYAARGWVLHHNTDIWRGAAPINHSNHGLWVTGGAWLTHHLWEHYLFTQDKAFLEEKAFPIMKEASVFFVDFLIEDEETGYLISSPSNSPEIGGMVAGPTMDHQIIRSLLQKTVRASEIIENKDPLMDTLSMLSKRIAPTKIGKHGQIQEWMEDIDDPNNKHRHISHLWAHHPGDAITLKETPNLAEAVKTSLIHRGDEGTGWSLAWKINQWARLKDGEHAADLLKLLYVPAETPTNPRGGSYPNLFDSHPPFQIDGNFGASAGIIEMIVQSHRDIIEVLPALPELFKNGSIKGVKARGGFELDITWKNGEAKSVLVKSLAGKHCKIKMNGKIEEFETETGGEYVFEFSN